MAMTTQPLRHFLLQDDRFIPPFNEPASELSFLGKPLKLHQSDLLADYFGERLELHIQPLERLEDLPRDGGPCIVFRESIYFDRPYLDLFYRSAEALARKTGRGLRAAYAPDDPVFKIYVQPLTRGFPPALDAQGNPSCYLADLWYFPNGYTEEVDPLIVPAQGVEKGFYSVPHYMSQDGQNLTHRLSERVLFSIESWMHVYFANTVQGVFARGSRFEEYIKKHNLYQLKVLWRAILEQKQILSCSELVKVGPGTQIHPAATVLGPTTIGANCYIGPGAVIDNCHIGDNVTIDQGCVLMLSVIGNNCFFPFRASSYLSVFMDNSILAQNTCVQMCVIGRSTFIGAGSTFTDFNLASEPIKTMGVNGLASTGQIVLGSCVGHNCRIGAGFIFYPGRMVESDTILAVTPTDWVVVRNIRYDHSAHHNFRKDLAERHKRYYPRKGEAAQPDEW